MSSFKKLCSFLFVMDTANHSAMSEAHMVSYYYP